MKQITSQDLADLLNKGFEGRVNLSGSVYCWLKEEDGKDRKLIYQIAPKSKFSLERAEGSLSFSEGSYILTSYESQFYFRPAKERPVEARINEKEGDVMAFDIDFPIKGILQIQPRNIIF